MTYGSMSKNKAYMETVNMETVNYFAEQMDVISTHGLIGNRGINMQVQAYKRSRGECKRGRREGTNLDDRERERKRWDKRGGSPRLWKLVWCSCGLRNRGESKELHSPVISLTHKLLAISRLCWSRVGNTRSTLPPRYVPTSLSSLPTLLRSGWSLKISTSCKWQMGGARTWDLRIRE